MPSGRLILLPVPIADGALHTLPAAVSTHTAVLRHYFVEALRTARRTLRALHPTLPIDDIQFAEINEHTPPDLRTLRAWLEAGHDVGVMSEAGCPGIADPGAALAAEAHRLGAAVVPVVGPSSILLALMASGLNGQRFAFGGYLPAKAPARGQRIAALEAHSRREGQTQIFIETPYRNAALLDDFLQTCDPQTWLCIAQSLTGPAEWVRTRRVAEWRADKPALQKAPAVFCMLAA